VTDRSSRPADLALAVVVILATAMALSAMPPVLSMGIAVVAAISWCLWLDRHPAP
jgi:hypothetical protein